jgi:RNAse (barnase) inhibitor barstar
MNRFEATGFRCVHFIDEGEADDELDCFKKNGIVLRISFKDVASKTDVFREFDRAFSFPFFGNNWDALNDCLSDLSWLDTGAGVVLVISNYRQFLDFDVRSFGMIVDIWLDCAEFWHGHDKPFHIVFC